MEKILKYVALCLVLLPVCAYALGVPVNSINLSGTITTTNTFQVVQASNGGRIGCTIQNTSANTEYVYFDKGSSTCADAKTATAFALTVTGQAINCAVADDILLKDTVCITGTSGGTFTANFQ